MMLKDSGLISKLAKEDKSLAEQIKDWFANFSAEIEKAFASIREEHEEARAMKEYAAELQQLWEDELIKAAKSGESTSASKNAKNNSAVKYYVREEFYKEFDSWDKKNTNKTFVVGKTSDALLSVGMKNQDIVLRSGTVLQKIRKHKELTFDIFRNIPELLEHPIIIQFSDAINPQTQRPKYDSRITVLGELYTDGKPVLVSLELMPTNQKRLQSWTSR